MSHKTYIPFWPHENNWYKNGRPVEVGGQVFWADLYVVDPERYSQNPPSFNVQLTALNEEQTRKFFERKAEDQATRAASQAGTVTDLADELPF